MCSTYPAMALHMQNSIGVIKENAEAHMVVLDKNLQLKQVL
jgi:N-acetylglucosamine-6-phosphate deacetylase